jgi:aryl-alcohol dehydrogenase-like predicted oxidoreductase
LKANVRIVDAVKEPATRREATPAQIALASVLAQGENVVTIPGASKRKHLEENLGDAFVQLMEAQLTWLEQTPAAVGGRY